MTMVMRLKLFRQVARISSPHSFSMALPAVGDVFHINHFAVSIVHFPEKNPAGDEKMWVRAAIGYLFGDNFRGVLNFPEGARRFKQ